MSDLERIREWIKSFPGMPEDMAIDYTHNNPINAGLFPQGRMEVARTTDIGGNKTVTNQYNFSLMPVFIRNLGEDTQATENAEWVMDFQQWIQEQSIIGAAPTFGNIAIDREIIRAQNGMLYSDRDSGVSAYTAVLTLQFKNYYKSGGN